METSRSVKRIEAISKYNYIFILHTDYSFVSCVIERSPIFSQMSSTMLGLSTIRAFKAENMLVREFDNCQDHHSSSWWLFIAASRAFGFWLDLICITFIGLVIFVLLMFRDGMQLLSNRRHFLNCIFIVNFRIVWR